MLLTKEIEVKLHACNIKHYENLGYDILRYFDKFGQLVIKRGTSIKVNVADLPEGSHVNVDILCDYCKETIITKPYQAYIKQNKKSVIKKDCCKSCQPIKNKESLMLKYGVDNVQSIPGVKEKTKATCLEIYGVEHHLASEHTKSVRKKNNKEKYGVENISQLESVKQKVRETTLKHYNVENPFQSEIIKKQIRKNNFDRYGVECNIQRLDVQAKIRQTMYQNGTAPSSTQQIHLSSILKGELNYPLSNCLLDIAFPDQMIYLEYDGSGHQLQVNKFNKLTQEEFDHKERKRSYFLIRQGWREIRIISRKDYLPSDEKILEMIVIAKDYLINNDRHYIHFDIDNSKIICSQFEIDYDYGKLRKIKKAS